MKKLINLLKYIVYHKTNNYVTLEANYCHLSYTEYFLYRIDKIFFIKTKRLIDTASSLCNKKRNMWYYNYPELKLIKN